MQHGFFSRGNGCQGYASLVLHDVSRPIGEQATVSDYHAMLWYYITTKRLTPRYSNAHAYSQENASAQSCHNIYTLTAHMYPCLLALLASAKPSAKPARCLCSLVLDGSIKLVRCSIDLLAGLVQLLFSPCLGLLILFLCIGAVGIKLLFKFACFGLGLLGLLTVSIVSRLRRAYFEHSYRCALPRTAS